MGADALLREGGLLPLVPRALPESRRSVARGRVLSRRLDPLDGEPARVGGRRPRGGTCGDAVQLRLLARPLRRPSTSRTSERRSRTRSPAAPPRVGREPRPDRGEGGRLARGRRGRPRDLDRDLADGAPHRAPRPRGAVSVLDFTRRPLTLGCTLTRRTEAYHEEARDASRASAAAGHGRRAPWPEASTSTSAGRGRPRISPSTSWPIPRRGAASSSGSFRPDATSRAAHDGRDRRTWGAPTAPHLRVSRGDRRASVHDPPADRGEGPSAPEAETSIEVIKRFESPPIGRLSGRRSRSALGRSWGAAAGVLFGVEINLFARGVDDARRRLRRPRAAISPVPGRSRPSRPRESRRGYAGSSRRLRLSPEGRSGTTPCGRSRAASRGSS